MNIPISKPSLGSKEAKAAAKVILSGWVTQGPKVEEFEKKFAKYVGSKYAVAISSCTTALHLALIISGVKQGDEVICPSLSFIATANSIKYIGATPIFADVDKQTYNIDPRSVEKLITKKTKAILIVHQMGIPADIKVFQKICKEYNLELIEDAACAAGSEYQGKKIGSHSDLVCFSFHPRKVITTGDGGMIATSNKEYYERLKLLRQHGMSVNDRIRHLSKKIIKEEYLEVGYNYRMTDIQAAIGIEQLAKLDELIKKRQKVANIYNAAFKKNTHIRLPEVNYIHKWNYQSYPIYLKSSCNISRDVLMQKLFDTGIIVRHGIMTAHRTLAYSAYKNINSLTLSEDLSDRSLLLPMYSSMSIKEIKYVIKKVNNLVK